MSRAPRCAGGCGAHLQGACSLTCRPRARGHSTWFGNGHIPARRRRGRHGRPGQGSPDLPAVLKGQSDGHRREPWFKRPGSESRSAAVFSLASDSASRRPPIAPLQIFAICDLLHSWGEIAVLSATLPNPVAGAMPPLHDLEATKTTPAQTLFAKRLEAASPIIGSPVAPRHKKQQYL